MGQEGITPSEVTQSQNENHVLPYMQVLMYNI